MFFSGDSSTRKRVDLGGRSSKERDRQKFLEQTRLERNRRLSLRQHNCAALKIQKWYRGRVDVKYECAKSRQQFYVAYGGAQCENVVRDSFGPQSGFLRHLLFFFEAQNDDDLMSLVECCRLFQKFANDSADILRLFGGNDYLENITLVDYRVKKLALLCLGAVYKRRDQFKNQVLMPCRESNVPAVILLKAVVVLINPKLPWVGAVIHYLLQNNALVLLRDVIIAAKEGGVAHEAAGKSSPLQLLLCLMTTHMGHISSSLLQNPDPRQSFSSQILTIPFLWTHFPYLKQVFVSPEQTLCHIQTHLPLLHVYSNPPGFPAHACLLGNLLEAAPAALSSSPNSRPFHLVKDLASLLTSLFQAVSPLTSKIGVDEEESTSPDCGEPNTPLDGDLEKQILTATDSRFLTHLIHVLFKNVPVLSRGGGAAGEEEEVDVVVGVVCAFVYSVFNALPNEHVMTVLAYRTELVPVLWSYIRRCHEAKQWPPLVMPLAVFCPVYRHILTIVDNEEFYEKGKPLSLSEVRDLVVVLKEVLWSLLWSNPVPPPSDISSTTSPEFVHHRAATAASELLSQLQDWNSRRRFADPSTFHADGVNDVFVIQAVVEGSRANIILKQAPFLVPFTSRVKIFTSQLALVRQREGSSPSPSSSSSSSSSRYRLTIRRDHILEDAFDQLTVLSEDELRGVIRVMFINEFGAEEAGIDGGGIFKDFMENITRAGFDVQYGLFKETADRMLFPNPGSGMIHERHLHYFHFLGTVLGKAMFEGILVDVPFATFFLTKLKQKHNYLNDLPSLDPELYRHLIFLKRFEGDVSALELYFVVVSNEYGEQREEELLPGGRNIRVTDENVITFIHLTANHRLNSQIRQQSSHFLRGFRQLIRREWIEMFNEHEIQLLVSGSVDDGLDVDDLRSHTVYAGGYHDDHRVVNLFWEVLKGFSLENQMRFLKFVTGCSRGPLLGFRYLEPLFCIQRVVDTTAEEAIARLPTSATCMNLLKLPPYRNREQLEFKLLYAIKSDAGFDLS